jgi:hypothetical protein
MKVDVLWLSRLNEMKRKLVDRTMTSVAGTTNQQTERCKLHRIHHSGDVLARKKCEFRPRASGVVTRRERRYQHRLLELKVVIDRTSEMFCEFTKYC